ncbi:hypothetical protein AB0M02_33660 [Actinoplanes sp. NPDC051861]|uniref:hypothetical protein n=1 Tax=Actinoplanes sp. NPDC051861 TaxID=3155170 RepID=UPI0034294A64
MTRRLVPALLAVTLAALSTLAGPASVATAAGEGTSVTVPGRGEFAALRVTVSQTTDLINQVVTVSWTGGKPTVDSSVHTDYLQIMQCWGDDPAGPDREQCQFGALHSDTRGGLWTGSRQVTYGDLDDPEETIEEPAGGNPAFVPFRPVSGEPVTSGGGGEYFEVATTNEIPYGRTGEDGSGEEFFEAQTATEAPGLGCGARLADGGARSCWLVIVPRGSAEVDGSTGDAKPHRWLDSSPLSASNWANRIAVPLKFQPLGRVCPLGAAERRTIGAEAMAEAMLRWQPALCAGGERVFGFSTTTDNLARGQLTEDEPGLVFVNRPVAGDPARPRVYAPVAVSGLAIAVNIDWQSGLGAGPEDLKREGKRIPPIKLTPRLVAKLLTQSYRTGADFSHQPVAANPLSISYDPEFQQHNPDWVPAEPDSPASAKQMPLPIGDALVSVGQTDMATLLWEWVNSDAEAKAFLAGTADQWGMRVNPIYRELSWPVDIFPKSDLYCVDLRADDGVAREWCTLDMHPYANHMHDSARSASRGDTLVRNATSRDSTGAVVGWKKGTPQSPGKRAVLAVTDVATAERYGLPTVQLRNASGAFVAPSTPSLLAGVSAMTQSPAVSGVLDPNPATKLSGAYPLTSLLYAATVPSGLDKAAGTDYAALLRYAAGDGQTPGVTPGTLPYGYAPLPQSLRAATLAAAQTVLDDAGRKTSSPSPAATTTAPVTTPGGTTPATATPAATTPAAGSAPNGAAPTATPSGHGSAVPIAQAAPTPGHPLGNLRYALVVTLAVGCLAGLIGPVLMALARRRRRVRRAT